MNAEDLERLLRDILDEAPNRWTALSVARQKLDHYPDGPERRAEARRQVLATLDAHSFESVAVGFGANDLKGNVATCSCGRESAAETKAEACAGWESHRAEMIVRAVEAAQRDRAPGQETLDLGVLGSR